MLNAALLMALSLAYVGILFGIAYLGDRRDQRRDNKEKTLSRPVVYSLTLAVYCTSWTFYGAVGTAASSGWQFIPIYLGPALTFILGWDLLQRVVTISKRQNLTSIADFIAARYGRAHRLAVLVTVVAVIGTVPYIALQLKAIVMGYAVLTGGQGAPANQDWNSTALYAALALALFAILFGTRHLDATEHHRGMMLAIAFESVVKLLAFIAVGLFALYGIFDGPGDMLTRAVTDARLTELFSTHFAADTFFAQLVLAMAAILCLPRQFHVGVVECGGNRDLRSARWAFPLYLAIITVFVLPIALAGLVTFPGDRANADTFVLALPMTHDQGTLSVLAFLGGFSAATGMVIVASVALATMVSNEIVLPLLLRSRSHSISDRGDFSNWLLNARRITIVGIALIGYVYYRLTAHSAALAAIGLLSFAAAVQFAPALVAGVYWRRANRTGAMLGLTSGFLLWGYTLLLPAVARASGLGEGFLAQGPFGLAWLRPEALFGIDGISPIANGVLWSLGVNIAALVLGSLRAPQSVSDELQAMAFMAVPGRQAASLSPRQQRHVSKGDLVTLAERFLGRERAERAFEQYHFTLGKHYDTGDDAPTELVQFTERLLAGSIGAASARVVMTTALHKSGMELTDVVTLLDQTSAALRFNRELLEATLENLSQGVAVVDEDLRIVGWNRRYLELLRYPDDMVYIGQPVAELIRFNAARGLLGPGRVEEHIERRLEHMRAGHEYRFERVRRDGRVLEMHGKPMPGGGYITTFTDITEFKRVEAALRESERSVRLYTDNAPLMLAFIDREGRYRFANKAYLQFAGTTAGELIGRRVEDVLTEHQLLERSAYMEAAFAGKRQNFELELEPASGEIFYALGTYIPERGENGRVIGFYAMFQDISQRRHAELELRKAKAELELRVKERTRALTEAMTALAEAKADAEQANLGKTRFLAAATHDLLQPLNAARLFTSVLADRQEELSPEHSKLVEQIDGSLGAAEDLLGALLDISKLDAGALVPEYEVFPVRRLLEAILAQFAPLAEERGLSLKIRPCKAVVRTDRRLLRRILQNLLVNALRYTEEGGVVIGCRRRDDNVEIQVWDTGCGIPEQHLSTVFVEFQRLENGVRSKEKGLGLGLAIVDRIARMLDHPVKVQSRVGRGTMFSVTVPLAPALSVPSIEPARTLRRGQPTLLKGARLLCVDNQPEILEAMSALLLRWGCEPILASSLGEAERLLEGQPAPHAMLVDYHLNDGENGIDLMIAIRERYRQDLPGALITADHSDALRVLARREGYPLLRKPVKPASLRATLDSLLRDRAAA